MVPVFLFTKNDRYSQSSTLDLIDPIVLVKTIIEVVIILFIIVIIGDYLSHIIDRPKSDGSYGYATYVQFEKEFNKHKWNVDSRRIYENNNSSKTHLYSDELLFDNIYMIFPNPIDYWRYKIFFYKYVHDHKIKPTIHDWV